MRWIILAIVACVVPYTYLTLKHRKPGPAHLPYADNKSRAEVARLLDAGYRRFAAPLQILTGQAASTTPARLAAVADGPGGVPAPLAEILLDLPQLPNVVRNVEAAAQAGPEQPYTITFTCDAPGLAEQLTQAWVFVRDDQVTITPRIEPRTGEEVLVTGAVTLQLDLPANTFPRPGEFRVALAATKKAASWSVRAGPRAP